MRWSLAAIVLLAACSNSEEKITISPKLECAEVVKCHVISWRLGWRDGPSVDGVHITCRCSDS